MQNNWQKIWNQRQLETTLKSTLQQLIAVDGFDGSWGGIDETAWMEYIESLTAKLQISAKDSIFEVGCGAGAFLYPFYQKGNRVAGIDYSENLAKIAINIMPRADIIVGEAINIPQKPTFDFVVANGVFFYFKDCEYAAEVLSLMLQMANKGVGIFDLPDWSKKEEAISMRKAKLGDAEYEEKYRGLEHLYYKKEWFEQVLANKPVKVVIEDLSIKNYGNSRYRFNVFIHKL